MPANKRVLLRRLHSVRNTRKITHTMEMVATARLQRARKLALAARPYTEHLQRLIADLSRAESREVGPAGAELRALHPLLEARPVKRAVLIVLSSDRGLCGSFNANVLRLARQEHAARLAAGQAVELVAGGRKALAAFRHARLELAGRLEGKSERPDFARARALARRLVARFLAGELDEALVAYSYFDSMMRQSPRLERLLPCTGADDEATDREGAPPAAPRSIEYIFHPNPAAILERVLPLVVETTLFATLLESAAGEQAARRVAMKNASDNADEMARVLTQIYNRVRQTQITTELLEVVGGADALAAAEG